MSSEFERVGDEVAWAGRIARVHVGRFRHADGEEVEREWIEHPGAVAVVAHDDETVWLVRQPREATGEPDLLELPAGKLDGEDEAPLETARRELVEEIGMSAASWRELGWFYTSPGFTDERVVVFAATDLSEKTAEVEEDERIHVIAWPLQRLDEAIDACHDSKSLIGLQWLRAERSR